MTQRDTYRIYDYYPKFKYSGLNYFKELGTNEKTRRLTQKQYKEILITYFKNYFYELFFLNKPMYFFLGGFMSLCRFGNKVIENKKKGTLEYINHTVGLFWFNRPSQRHLFSMKIKKQKGRTSRMPKLESEWKDENLVEDLDPFLYLKRKHFKNNTYFQTQ